MHGRNRMGSPYTKSIIQITHLLGVREKNEKAFLEKWPIRIHFKTLLQMY